MFIESQSQSNSQSPQEKQQSQPICHWSAQTTQFGQSPSPFPRDSHVLSTSATSAGELFLFGGKKYNSIGNDVYVISTRDFSTTLLRTSGEVPSPRFGHRAVLTDTILLIWGGMVEPHDQATHDRLYLLNLVSREWIFIVVNGHKPGGRFFHTMTLVDSKLFVFGGWSIDAPGYFNDIWALDLNYLKSDPFWESYEPAPGNEKPLPRTGHVAVTTGSRIIIFGGRGSTHSFNDTWSFDISTRKWTELQCTGSIPSPRADHAAVLLGDVMYVFGGFDALRLDGAYLGDLTALNLSTQRWIAFQDIGSSPSPRFRHAMAYDGTRVFVLGGVLLLGTGADEKQHIYVLDTEHLGYLEPDFDDASPSERITQLVQKSSASPSTRRQPHRPSSSSDAHLAHLASPIQKATPENLDHPTSQQITRRQNPSLDGLPWRPMGVSGGLRRVPDEDDDSEGSTEHHVKLVAPDAHSWKEPARLEDGGLIELRRQLSGTLIAKTEQDQHIAQLTNELALKNALLAPLEEEKKCAALELHELQAKLDESLMSRDHALEQAQSALHKASRAAEANEQSQRELTETRAELEARSSESAAFRLRLADMENDCSKSNGEADTYGNQGATGLVNTDEDPVVHRLMERIRVLEAEVASLRWNEKSFETMECRNED